MSKRDLLEDKKWIEQLLTKVAPNDVDRIALYAIDRAIAAEKERDDLRKRVLKHRTEMELLLNRYLNSGQHGAASELEIILTKHFPKEPTNEPSK